LFTLVLPPGGDGSKVARLGEWENGVGDYFHNLTVHLFPVLSSNLTKSPEPGQSGVILKHDANTFTNREFFYQDLFFLRPKDTGQQPKQKKEMI